MMAEETAAVAEPLIEPTPGFRERFWAGMPEKIQVVLVLIACLLAFAAAFAPLVYLLRRLGVG